MVHAHAPRLDAARGERLGERLARDAVALARVDEEARDRLAVGAPPLPAPLRRCVAAAPFVRGVAAVAVRRAVLGGTLSVTRPGSAISTSGRSALRSVTAATVSGGSTLSSSPAMTCSAVKWRTFAPVTRSISATPLRSRFVMNV